MDKIWYKNYDPGVPHTIDPDQYASIPEMLEECFKKYADQPCFVNFGETLTFKQVDELSQAYAGFLQTECKLEKGDRVAIMMPNTLQYPVALFGVLRAGMVNVNISPLYTAQEVHFALQTSGAKCILVLANFAYVLEKAISGTKVKYSIVTEIGDLFRPHKRLLFNFITQYVKKMVPEWYIPNAISFREAIEPSYKALFKKPELCGEDLAYLQFTEGREIDIPKCAKLTHRNFIANGLQFSAWLIPIQHLLKGVALAPLPFFKLIATSLHSLAFMRNGIVNNLITNPRNTSLLIKEIKRYPPLFMSGVRTIFSDLLFNQTFQDLDLLSLKLVFFGGMVTPQTLAARWESLTKTVLIQGYVLTEGSPGVMGNPVLGKNFTGALGLPFPSTDVKICDEQGQELLINMRGEIWIKGPQVCKGYWNQTEETQKAFTEDGWFKTGDIGYMNEEGYVFFLDRKEDVIKIEKNIVYPSEVENTITEINGVEEAIVVSALEGTELFIKAYIIKSDSSLSKETIFEHCRRYLADYQIPKKIEFQNQLPRSATGYILRNKLRENQGKPGNV